MREDNGSKGEGGVGTDGFLTRCEIEPGGESAFGSSGGGRPAVREDSRGTRGGKFVVLTDKVSRSISGQNAKIGTSEEFLEAMTYAKKCSESCGLNLRISASTAKKELYVTGLSLENACAGVPEIIEPFDIDVLTAYGSILDEGLRPVSARQIAEKLSGQKTCRDSGGSGVVQSVRQSMEKLMSTVLRFDWNEHAAMKKIQCDGEKVKSFRVSGNMVYAREVTIEYPNGAIADGYVPLAVPDLYVYAKATGQISTVDERAIRVEGVSCTRRGIVIRNYIVREVEWAKHSRSRRGRGGDKGWVIVLETLIKSCRLEKEAESRTILSRIRKTVFLILDYYESSGYISRYEKMLEGKSVRKVCVYV